MSVTDRNSRWIRQFPPAASVKARLICFPPAGSAASFYRSWPAAFPPDIDAVAVQYPGRQERFGEECLPSMSDLADAATAALLPLTDLPLAFFGHSMGASLAFEVGARLEASHGVRLARLFLAARKAPHRVGPRGVDCDDDDALLAAVAELGSPDIAVLADPQLRELVLPAIRADFRICENYRRTHAPSPLDTGIVFYRGSLDPATEEDDVQHWSDVSKHGAVERVFTGGHFFVVEHERAVVRDAIHHLHDALPR
jgi:pyochelin biosynthetic protein PchC